MEDACWQISADDGPVALRRRQGYARLVKRWSNKSAPSTP